MFFIFGEIDFSVFTASQIVIDIALVTLMVYILLRFIARVHAFQIVITTLIFGLLLFLSYSFNLVASQLVLQGIFIVILISLPLMFQNEIRKNFEKFGNSPLIFFKKEKNSKRHFLIKTIKQSSTILAEKKHGAIIVIEKGNPLYVYAETGVILNAEATKELILNIFFPKSPLHDGAIIIRENTIISAGSVLPLTHSTTEHMYGTRHKSAIGLSEVTDAIVVVISEERGEISIAHEGELIRNVSSEYLEHYLEENL